jgi:hypothetical protein
MLKAVNWARGRKGEGGRCTCSALGRGTVTVTCHLQELAEFLKKSFKKQVTLNENCNQYQFLVLVRKQEKTIMMAGTVLGY